MRAKTPSYMRIDPPARRMPFGIEKEIDDSRKMGFVLVVVILAVVIGYAVWIRH